MKQFLPVLLILATFSNATPCVKHFPDPSDTTSFVCVCTESVCDDVEDIGDNEGMALYTTSLDGGRLTKAPFDGESISADLTLTLDTSKREQSIIGFGGAMTDSTVINLNRLNSDKLRNLIIEGYFGRNGLRYNMVRIPIGSCDFPTREYSYLETPNDFELHDFALSEKDEWKIAFTKQAMSMSNGTLVFGTPWSAPAWMKSNGHMRGVGTLKECAQYSETFVEEYTARGVPIWALTVQNEPSSGSTNDYAFETMYFSPEAERDFLRDYLYPALTRSATAKETQIIIHDQGRTLLQDYAEKILSDPAAEQLIAGIGVHWYKDNGSDPMILTNLALNHPNQFILYTESCIESAPKLGAFDRAFRYAKNILENLSHRVGGWVDWNLVLDSQGGPNSVNNFADSPVIIDDANESFYRQPMYYAIGHFSRFIARGARRVSLELSSTAIDAVAFLNPDESIAIVMLNDSPRNVSAAIGSHTVKLKPSSINTLYFKDESYVGKLASSVALFSAAAIVMLCT